MADALRTDFAFPAPTGTNADIAADIAETLSVSLHVRRGDYLAAQAYAVCDQAYYDRAIAALARTVIRGVSIE